MSDFAPPWTVVHQAPLSMGLSGKNTGGLQFPSPGDRPDSGIKPASPLSAGGFFTTSATWETHRCQVRLCDTSRVGDVVITPQMCFRVRTVPSLTRVARNHAPVSYLSVYLSFWFLKKRGGRERGGGDGRPCHPKGNGAKRVLEKRKWILNLFPIKKKESGSTKAPEGTFGGGEDHKRPVMKIHYP